GVPHSLACAALLPGRVPRAVVMVTPPPNDDGFAFLAGTTQSNVDEFNAALAGPDAIAAYLAPYIETLRTRPEALLDELAAELPPRATFELGEGMGHMLYDAWADAFAWAAV